MARPLVPEGVKKDANLQVRATRQDVDEIKASVQNIRASIVVLKKLDGGDKYPSTKMADILKYALRQYNETLREELTDRINAMS